MKPKFRWIIVAITLAIVASGVALYYYIDFLGVAHVKYVRDYSPELTQIAKSALPIIKQADDYFNKHGKYPSVEELRDLVKVPSGNPSGYQMSGNDIFVEGYYWNGHPIVWDYAYDSYNQAYLILICPISWSQQLHYGRIKKEDGGPWSVNDESTLKELPVKLNP